MPFRVAWFVSLFAGILVLAGCSTASRSIAARAWTTNDAPTTAANVRRESPEEVERRAEAHAHFLAALSADLNNETECAEQEYEKALENDPTNEALAIDLSRRFVQRKDYEHAVTVLKQAADVKEPSASVLSRLGFVYLQMGRTNEAIAAHRSAIKKQPSSIAGYQALYTLYRQSGQTNDARAVLDDAAKQKKVDAAFLTDLATLFFLEDAPKKAATNNFVSARAKDALTRAAAMNPTNIFVLQKLAQGFRLAGESAKASEILARLVKQFPEAAGLREELVELLLRSNNTKEAAEQLEALTRDNPTNPQTHYFLGAIAYDEQRYADAVEHYRKALLLKPDFEQVYYDIAAAKIAMNEPRDALEYLRQARRQFKQSFLGEFFSAVAYVRLKEFTNALSYFNTAEIIGSVSDSNRLTHTFYFQFGSACERAGRIDEAEKHFERSLQISPDFAEALNYLGYMWAERGTNLDQARKMIERAVSLQPTNAAYLDSLGWVLFKQGKASDALPQIEKAIQFNKEPDATLYDHLGDIHAALKQHDKARDAWKKALDVEPNKEIEKKLRGKPNG
jgi:tetratricopeptide (TPR) repeat protein